MALERLLEEISKKKLKVLIAIDEIVNNHNVRAFSGIYQILLRKKLPVFLLMKIWFELPETESKVVALLVKNGQMKNKDIREELSLSDSQMAVYRDRLKRRGIIDTSRYGYFDLLLPRFREIVSFWID